MGFLLRPAGFPEQLRTIHDAPKILYGEGDPNVLQKNMIAIVGARECTEYGATLAYDFGCELAKAGLVVVSGLALGIDTKAHEGALAGGGETVAVLGCGLDCNYLASNRPLRERIIKQGAVVTEYPAEAEAFAPNFPKRNRIISGLSQAVIVIEAGLKSGSLITGRWALEQGREIFAVPGSIRSRMSDGTNRLIQRGAKLITKVEDVFEELPWLAGVRLDGVRLAQNEKLSYTAAPSGDEEKILQLLSDRPLSIDGIAVGSELQVEKVSALLVELEIAGRVKGLPGGNFVRSS